MNGRARVSEKGQVTIPKRLRDRLGIRPGQVLDFHEERGKLVVVKTETRDPVTQVYGAAVLEARTDELVKRMRGDADAV